MPTATKMPNSYTERRMLRVIGMTVYCVIARRATPDVAISKGFRHKLWEPTG